MRPPRYFSRGDYGNHPRARAGERELQILRILSKNAPKWVAPSTFSKELGIKITNAQNLLKKYKKRGLVEAKRAKLGKYELAVYRLIEHGRWELQQLESQFAGRLV